MSNDLILELKKPFKFEGEEYKTIDLTGLENLTGVDSIQAQRTYQKLNGKDASFYLTDPSYHMIVAARATELPVEFFNALPISAFTAVSNKVMVFLTGGEEQTENQ